MSQSVFNRVSARTLGDISALTAMFQDKPANANSLDLAACSLRGLLVRPHGELEQVAEAA